MSKLTKNQKKVNEAHGFSHPMALNEAIVLLKKSSYVKFDASFDIDVRLGVDPKKADQMVRGTVVLPHGTGRKVRILALCTPDKEKEAKEAGADHVGLDEYLEKISKGWVDIDVIVAMPSVMAKLGRYGKVIGPRGLMPNPKSGTVTQEVGRAVKQIKQGKVSFKVDKYGIVHASIGRVSFEEEKVAENVKELMAEIEKQKPSKAKGNYIQSITLTTTMGRGIAVDLKSIKQ